MQWDSVMKESKIVLVYWYLMMASTKDKFQTNVQYILSIKSTVSIFIIKFTLTPSFIKLKNLLILEFLKKPAAKPLWFMGLNLGPILDIINYASIIVVCMIYIGSMIMFWPKNRLISIKRSIWTFRLCKLLIDCLKSCVFNLLQSSCSLLMLSTNRILMSDIAAVVKIINQHWHLYDAWQGILF